MKCNQCGREVNVGKWKFCPDCGGSLYDEKIIQFINNILFSSRWRIAGFVVLELFILGYGSFLILGYRQEIAKKNVEIAELLDDKQQDIELRIKVKEKIMPSTYWGKDKRMGEIKITSLVYGKIKIESVVPGITEKETQVIDIKPESKIIFLSPEISEEGYQSLVDSKKATMNINVFYINDRGEEKNISTKNEDLFFYSRNDIAWREDGVNNLRYSVRWINKDRKEIVDLVRLSADHMKELGGKRRAMEGVLADREEIKRQLQAIFLTISRDYQIRYVMAPYSYDDISVQKVKWPEEVIREKSGLCIELSLLMAAALENVGLNGVIVVTPGHAWVGVEVGAATRDYIFIETTALEESPEKAMEIADDNWKKIRDFPSQYDIINVNELRAEGLQPIKY